MREFIIINRGIPQGMNIVNVGQWGRPINLPRVGTKSK